LLDGALRAIEELERVAKARRVLLLVSESRDRSSRATLEAVVRRSYASGVQVYALTYSTLATAFTTKTAPVTRLPIGMRRSRPGREEPGAPPRWDRTPVPTEPEQRVDLLGATEELRRMNRANTTEVLAAASGGRTYSFAKQAGLEEALAQLGAELHSQYVLSFTASPQQEGFHALRVEARRKEAVVRTRAGFWTGRVE